MSAILALLASASYGMEATHSYPRAKSLINGSPIKELVCS
jgi:hypothetical protein